MRKGWSDKDAAPILGVHPHKVSQSLTLALRKIARLWRADPTRTMLAILAESEAIAYEQSIAARLRVPNRFTDRLTAEELSELQPSPSPESRSSRP